MLRAISKSVASYASFAWSCLPIRSGNQHGLRSNRVCRKVSRSAGKVQFRYRLSIQIKQPAGHADLWRFSQLCSILKSQRWAFNQRLFFRFLRFPQTGWITLEPWHDQTGLILMTHALTKPVFLGSIWTRGCSNTARKRLPCYGNGRWTCLCILQLVVRNVRCIFLLND